MAKNKRGDVFVLPELRPQDVVGRVHDLAADSSNIHWTDHAQERVDEREITVRQVLSTLRLGKAVDRPRSDQDGDWKITLVRRSAGTLVKVVVAISGDRLYVITTMKD